MQSGQTPVKVWDAPVRLFHWLLVILIGISIYTGLSGGNAMLWHMYSGYAVLTLIVFRILWAFVGSSTARFGDFLYGPAKCLRFARDVLTGRPAHFLGHNPLGGWMVLVLLLAILFQVSTGLFSNDDIATDGPLTRFISKDLSDTITTWHKLSINVLYGLIAVHVLAVLFHLLVRRENLVVPMFTGRKDLPAGEASAPVKFASLWLAAALFALVALAVWLLVSTPTPPTT